MKTILVTGGTDGIGRAAAERLAADGARVLVHGRTRDKAERVVAELRAETGRDQFEAVAADLASLSGAARVVNVSSMAHSGGRIDFDDLDRARGYDGYGAYAASKLMNVLFTFDLAARLVGRGRPIAVNALHPGVIGTKLLREGFGGIRGDDVAQGAAGEVRLATDPTLEGVTGRYFDGTEESRATRAAGDRELQRRLYEVSLQRTGVTAA